MTMKDLNNKSWWNKLWINKTMKAIKDIKKWKVWNIKLKNIEKLDKEIVLLSNVIDNYRDNKISKDDFNKAFNVSEKLVWSIITDNYMTKFWKAPWVEIWLNKLPTTEKTKYNLWFKKHDTDSKIESFSTVDEVLDRMKYLYG